MALSLLLSGAALTVSENGLGAYQVKAGGSRPSGQKQRPMALASIGQAGSWGARLPTVRLAMASGPPPPCALRGFFSHPNFPHCRSVLGLP